MASPSPGYSITLRVVAPAAAGTTGELALAVAQAGGVLTALDVAESHPDSVVVDVTCDTTDADHADAITQAVAEVPGVVVRKVSDRTFLIHLGGKLEVTPKVQLRHRDDLARAYTPGVARVCRAIADNPEDARRLTIKRNTVAVVTDGSAVLGLGNLGPVAALPGHPGHRRDRLHRAGHRSGVRRDQPGGHRRAALLRDRAAAAGDARHPGL